tara:strand:+ start:78 stop:863 length:786 start_codon:yes stop_codon:yes gene_type:complete
MEGKIINSRNIPLQIQREVRKRCGFGCVLCGLPLYEYEHMEEWAQVKRHIADEITLLCDQHHREKTSKLLPKEIVIEANKNPFNLKEGVSKPYTLHYSGDSAKVIIGNVAFVNKDKGYGTQLIPILVDNIPIIGIILADGHFLLNMLLFDEFNNIILHIKNNQLIYKTDLFDIQFISKTITIREKLRKIFIVIKFETPNTIIISKGKFLINGVEIIIDNDKILVNNSKSSFSNFTIDSQVGISIGNNSIPSLFNMKEVKRY